MSRLMKSLLVVVVLVCQQDLTATLFQMISIFFWPFGIYEMKLFGCQVMVAHRASVASVCAACPALLTPGGPRQWLLADSTCRE